MNRHQQTFAPETTDNLLDILIVSIISVSVPCMCVGGGGVDCVPACVDVGARKPQVLLLRNTYRNPRGDTG